MKKFLKYELQSVAGMVGISVYILADTFFISVYAGADGLAMLNLVLPVYGVIYAIGSMIGIGSATRYGINRAKGEDTGDYFLQSVFFSILFSIPFMLTGFLAPQKFLGLLGADAKLAALGKSYLRIILTATPLFMANYTFTAFARNDHATSVAMTASIAGSLFNIVFDYILMFPCGLGLVGAALATAVCPAVTMLICGIHYLGRKNTVGFHWKRPGFSHLISCCKLGISAFVGEISSAVITIVFNMLILGIAGNTGVAAYGVIANMSAVAMSIFNGLAQGVQPLISENYGKNHFDRAKKLLKMGLCASLVMELAIVSGVWAKTDALIAVFNSEHNAALLRYAHVGLRLYFLGFLFAGINIMLVAYFSAVDNAKTAIAGSVSRGAVAIVGHGEILPEAFSRFCVARSGRDRCLCSPVRELVWHKRCVDLISRIGDDHLPAHLRTGTENGWSTKRRIRMNSPYSTLRVCEKSVFLWIMDVRKEADMDQITTGKFIAEERKRKGYTQKQLAEILGISDKTISKWERGNGFPEVSLLLPLCEELDVTVNELLTGERVSEEDYRKKAEENMVNLVKEAQESKKKITLSVMVIVLTLIAAIPLFLISGLAGMEDQMRIFLILTGIVVIVLGIAIACILDREAGAYECPECRERFVPEMSAYIMGPHTITRRKLKCPKCGAYRYCRKVLTK